MNDTFGSRVKELRKAHNLTQEELANTIGVTKGTVSVWERDGRMPEFQAMNALCRFFDVDIGYLTGENDEQQSTEIDKDFGDDYELHMLRGIAAKLGQLSFSSLMIVESVVNTAYKVDDANGNLGKDRKYFLTVKSNPKKF